MEPKTTKKPSRKLVVFKRELPFYLMLIPGVTFLIIFSYLPMFGLVMAFQDFTPLRSFKNSPWVGLKNFRDMLALPTFWNVVGNTLSIPIAKIILRLLVPLILALLLNEVVHHKFMRMAQTVFFCRTSFSGLLWAACCATCSSMTAWSTNCWAASALIPSCSWAATPGSPSLLFSPTSGKIWAIT